MRCHAVPMDPLDTVRRYAEAWQANDIDAVLASYHDDFVLHYFGESALAGDHIGRDAAIVVLMEATSRSKRQLDAIEDVLGGDRFAAIVAPRRRWRSGQDGATAVRLHRARRQARRVLAIRREPAPDRSPLEYS